MTSALDLFRGSMCTLALLALFAFPLGAQEPAPAPAPAPAVADPEARLIEAELLELAEGRIDEAVEIYRALLATPDLSPPLRARALFSIARAQRKRGELGAAKESYEKLVAEHPDQEKLVEASRRYLDELAEGAARLPEFDWVAEVEQNPQIQAQIFEWGMLLGGSSEEARKQGDEAARKLLSLGSTVIPTLEVMIERSQDKFHRAELASVLVRLGAVRHLPHLLGSSRTRGGSWSLFRSLPTEARVEAIRILASLPDDRVSRLFAAKGRIWLGSVERLDEDIRTLLEPPLDSSVQSTLPLDFEAYPENAAAYRDQLRSIAELSFVHYESTLQGLLLHAPELLRREDLEPLRTPREAFTGCWIEGLFQSRLEDLVWLLEGPTAQQLLALIRDQGMTGRNPPLTRSSWQATLVALPVPRRARILRATRSHGELLELALTEPEAVPEFAAFLLEDEKPHVEGSHAFTNHLDFASAPFRWDPPQQSGRRQGADETPPSYPPPPSVPPPLEEAMERVFRGSTEGWRRGVALELIVRAYPNARRESFDLLRDHLADPAADSLERVAALTGVLLRLPDHEPERDATLELVEQYCARIGQADWLPGVGREMRDGRFLVAIGSQQLGVMSGWSVVGEVIIDYLRALDSAHEATHQIERLANAFLPSIAAGRGIELYNRLSYMLRAEGRPSLGQQYAAFGAPLARASEEIDDPERLRALAEPLFGISDVVIPQPIRAWMRLLADPLVSPELRIGFLSDLSRHADEPMGTRGAFFHALDWSALVLADDPLADLIVRRQELVSFVAPLRLAARASPRLEVRRWAWEHASLPATPEELEPAIGSEDVRLRSLGYACLLMADDTRWLPLLHRAAREAPTDLRSHAIDRLAFFAAEESLPVLTALLDDPVFAVRAKALEALEKIEVTLSQQEKWRERFGKKKKD